MTDTITSLIEKPFAVTHARWGENRYDGVIQITKETEKTHMVVGGWRGNRETRVMEPPNYPARFDTLEEAEAAVLRGNAEWRFHFDSVQAAELALKEAKEARAEAALNALRAQSEAR